MTSDEQVTDTAVPEYEENSAPGEGAIASVERKDSPSLNQGWRADKRQRLYAELLRNPHGGNAAQLEVEFSAQLDEFVAECHGQREAARRLGISQSQIANIIWGRTPIRYRTAEKIFKAGLNQFREFEEMTDPSVPWNSRYGLRKNKDTGSQSGADGYEPDEAQIPKTAATISEVPMPLGELSPIPGSTPVQSGLERPEINVRALAARYGASYAVEVIDEALEPFLRRGDIAFVAPGVIFGRSDIVLVRAGTEHSLRIAEAGTDGCIHFARSRSGDGAITDYVEGADVRVLGVVVGYLRFDRDLAHRNP